MSLFGSATEVPVTGSRVLTAEPLSALYELMRSRAPSGDQTAVIPSIVSASLSFVSAPSVPRMNAPRKSPSGLPRRRSKTMRPRGRLAGVDAAAAEGGVAEIEGGTDATLGGAGVPVIDSVPPSHPESVRHTPIAPTTRDATCWRRV